MQEIEIKFQIDNIEKIKNTLLELGCEFSEELNQKDTIFVPDINNTTSEEGKMFVRIRYVNGKTQLNLKKQSNKTIQSKEIEFEVSNFDQANDFLNTIGLKEWVTVEKKRITTKYKQFNICIDDVKRLGQFVEIEIITSEKNKTDYYEKEIIKISKELGINTNNIVNNFYDTMISELNQKENELKN